jgi:hypothetical protein
MTFLVALLLVALWPTSVHADPITLVASAIAFLLPATTATIIGTVTIAQAIAAVAITSATIGLSLLFGSKLPQGGEQIDPGAAKENFTGEESPELRLVGRGRIGGVVVFGNTFGHQRYRLIAQCKGPIDGREATYLGGQEVLRFSNDEVASLPYAVSTGVSYVGIYEKDGDGTETAWTQLLTSFPTLWTANHRVRGISQVLARYASPGMSDVDFPRLYAGGAPQLEQVIRGEKVYDPRTGLTKWSDNSILVVLHILLTWPEFTLDSFDLDFISVEADRADELIEVNGGGVSPIPTEKLSRALGVWTSEVSRGDLMAQLLQSVGAEIVSRPDDKLGIALIDDDRTPELTIETRHIVELQWKSGPDSVERPNICRVKYYSPERAYEMTELMLHEFDVYGDHTGPSWARVQSEIDAVGEKPMDIDLPFCPSAAQAQRIARRIFSQARSDAGIVTTNMVGLASWGARVMALEMPDDLGTHNVAIGPPRVLDDRGLVEIPYVVVPVLSEWNPVVDSVPAPDTLPDFGQSDPVEPPDILSASMVGSSPDATRVFYDVDGKTYDYIEVSYRTFNADGNPTHWEGRSAGVEAYSGLGYTDIDVDLNGILSEFRVRGYTASHRSSQWSDTLRTTPT